MAPKKIRYWSSFAIAKTAIKACTSGLRKGSNTVRELEAVRQNFDADYYLNQYPDIRNSRKDPLLHFLRYGWREGRNPCAKFDTNYYLSAYPDVRAAQLNPFAHYLLYGKNEGRRCRKKATKLPRMDTPGKSFERFVRACHEASHSAGKELNHESLDIHWVIPDFARGGGGHMTIFRIIRLLELKGHKCTVWIDHSVNHKDCEDAYNDIVKYFQFIKAEVRFLNEGFFESSGDIVFATSWQTCWPVRAADGFREKFYFIQDHEPEFYPTGADSVLAKDSYGFGFAAICAGPWLATLMKETYGQWTRCFHLAPSLEYADTANRGKGKTPQSEDAPLKIAVYAREETARRCIPLAFAALHLLAEKGLAFEVHFFGQEQLALHGTIYDAWDHGVLEPEELAKLYCQCDIGICFSATNYSLVPQEMMACGLPVVELDGESTRSVFPIDAATLAGPKPRDIADKIAELAGSKSKRDQQAKAALRWVSQFSWESSADAIESSIKEYLDYKGHKNKTSRKPIKSAAKKLDIVIPTYNGLSEVKRLLGVLRQQRFIGECQIFCVDSSSTDTIPQSSESRLQSSLSPSSRVQFLVWWHQWRSADRVPADR